MNTPVKVGFLGPKGTFSQVAVMKYFGSTFELLDCTTIDDVFLKVEDGSINFGVVPVENSTEGAVNNTQDCFIDSEVRIVGEEVVPIEHNLMFSATADAENFNAIASHKQSLAQCRKWLQENYPAVRFIECTSNAEAARLAKNDASIGAIASELAASIYGLEIKKHNIQDQYHNRTRFLVLSKFEAAPTGNDKTSVLIYTENKPGALFRILEPFEKLQINLTKIETRPSKNQAWAYVFFIDFEGHTEDTQVQGLFKRLDTCTAEIKILGSYPISQS